MISLCLFLYRNNLNQVIQHYFFFSKKKKLIKWCSSVNSKRSFFWQCCSYFDSVTITFRIHYNLARKKNPIENIFCSVCSYRMKTVNQKIGIDFLGKGKLYYLFFSLQSWFFKINKHETLKMTIMFIGQP